MRRAFQAAATLVVVCATSWVAFRRFTFFWADEIFRGFYALALEKEWTTGPDKVSDVPIAPREGDGQE